MSITRNTLKSPDAFRLAKAIERDRDRIETVPSTVKKMAADYGKELGLELSPANVKTAMAAVGVEHKSGGWTTGKSNDRIAKIELFLEKVYGPKFTQFANSNGGTESE